MLAQSTDSGQLIAAAVIKLFHTMKLQVQDLRGIGIMVQLLEGNHSVQQDSTGSRARSIKEMLLNKSLNTRSTNTGSCQVFSFQFMSLLLSSVKWIELKIRVTDAADNSTRQEKTSSTAAPRPPSTPEPVPGTSRDQQASRRTPKHSRARLNLSIEVPSPSQVRRSLIDERRTERFSHFNNSCFSTTSKVDRSVLEALPAELREQVEQSWTNRSHRRSPSPQPQSLKTRPTTPPCPPTAAPALYTPPVGTLVLQIPNQPDSPGIVLELPNFSQVRMQPTQLLHVGKKEASSSSIL